jgi:nucleotide-binding universal stress UspA family protein
MAIKSILCIFGGSQGELNALEAAMILGKTYEARIRILHISSDPGSYAGIYGESIFASAEIIDIIENNNKEYLEKARQHTVSYAKKHNIPLFEKSNPATGASVQFINRLGMVASTIEREGRLSDLIIISHENTPVYDFITPSLFYTGRPVLLVPPAPKQFEWRSGVISFAWNESIEAARALFNYLALIGSPEKLYILAAEGHGHAHNPEYTGDLLEYLDAHSIKSEVVTVESKARSNGEALLMQARELNSDLLVMGAYGHSMLREIIFGGVTGYMLREADIPLLLSH